MEMAEIKKRKKSRVYYSISEFCSVSLLAASIKILLIPSYHSTDFEVHRHWLALTHSLPIQQWYLDETSPWTLDYPPFFAYFERFLSIFARVIDPQIVDLQKGLNYNAKSVIYFQRISVIVSDFVLLLGVFLLTRNLNFRKRFLIWCLVILSPSLIIVDHVHFQYNGFLIGILLISIWCLESGRDLLGGFTFAVLLCFKHLFAVAAPVYFVYLLRHYCWNGGLVNRVRLVSKIGALVVFIFTLAFGPFLYHGQAREVMRRMFPFGRGLCHAYWAPNFWALYIILDKGAASLLRKLGFEIKKPEASSFTGGLVGDSSPFSLLPQITPSLTLVIVLLAMSPCLVKIWTETRPRRVIRWISYAYTCGFMFGWHVHEKASLHFVIPLAFVAVDSSEDAKHHFITSIVCTYSVFPLLYGVQEYPVKILLLLCHSITIFSCFSSYFSHRHRGEQREEKRSVGGFNLNCMEKGYLWGIVAVESWCVAIHPLFFRDLSFMPLLLTSLYSAIGITYSWLWQLRRILFSPDFT